jgi:cardiolipin synthase
MTDDIENDPPLELIRSPRLFYERLLTDLAAAVSSIRVEMYIVEPGDVTDRLVDILVAKAVAGVSVGLIYDGFGSFHLTGAGVERLRRAGASVREYHPINPVRREGPLSIRGLFRRDHRKLVVIDGRVYYVGGMNIGERFADWEDLMGRGEGRPVEELAASFDQALAAQAPIPGEKLARLRRRRIEFLDSRPKLGAYPIKRLYLRMIKKARRRVWIAQAYFLPRHRLLKALSKAAQRGVDVRIVVPDRSDVMVADLAAWPAITRLVKKGIPVARFGEGMLHTKMAIIDDTLVFGAANLDSMSLYWNRELALMVRLPDTVLEAEAIFADYERRARPVTRATIRARPLWSRVVGRLLRPFHWIL